MPEDNAPMDETPADSYAMAEEMRGKKFEPKRSNRKSKRSGKRKGRRRGRR